VLAPRPGARGGHWGRSVAPPDSPHRLPGAAPAQDSIAPAEPALEERVYSASIQRASEKSFGVIPPSEWVHTETVTSL
jgi:hypothetical protein